MKLEDFFKDKYLSFIKDVLINKDYFLIRQNADRLLEYDELEFALNFDYAIAKSDIFPFEINDPITGEVIEDATEYLFLHYINHKITRAHLILEDYLEHCDDINKKVSEELDEYYEANMTKGQFVHLKLKRATSAKEVSTLKKHIKSLQKPIKKTSKATIEGKPINLLERYYLLNRLFEVDKTINTCNISKGEKDRLLGLILDCNTTNARHLLNGKYDAHLREDAINNYLKDIKEVKKVQS